ncbi:MAG TPA: hypothetical protein DHV63_10350 [Pseudomonas sp.]|nr:hypothetical protein [Pseudomonas sp.]
MLNAPDTIKDQRARLLSVALIEEFQVNEIAPLCRMVWGVQHVRDGQRVDIAGPFFTEEEARTAADLLRPSHRGARAYPASWTAADITRLDLADACRATRGKLADQLGISLFNSTHDA